MPTPPPFQFDVHFADRSPTDPALKAAVARLGTDGNAVYPILGRHSIIGLTVVRAAAGPVSAVADALAILEGHSVTVDRVSNIARHEPRIRGGRHLDRATMAVTSWLAARTLDRDAPVPCQTSLVDPVRDMPRTERVEYLLDRLTTAGRDHTHDDGTDAEATCARCPAGEEATGLAAVAARAATTAMPLKDLRDFRKRLVTLHLAVRCTEADPAGGTHARPITRDDLDNMRFLLTPGVIGRWRGPKTDLGRVAAVESVLARSVRLSAGPIAERTAQVAAELCDLLDATVDMDLDVGARRQPKPPMPRRPLAAPSRRATTRLGVPFEFDIDFGGVKLERSTFQAFTTRFRREVEQVSPINGRGGSQRLLVRRRAAGPLEAIRDTALNLAEVGLTARKVSFVQRLQAGDMAYRGLPGVAEIATSWLESRSAGEDAALPDVTALVTPVRDRSRTARVTYLRTYLAEAMCGHPDDGLHDARACADRVVAQRAALLLGMVQRAARGPLDRSEAADVRSELVALYAARAHVAADSRSGAAAREITDTDIAGFRRDLSAKVVGRWKRCKSDLSRVEGVFEALDTDETLSSGPAAGFGYRLPAELVDLLDATADFDHAP